LTDGSKEFEFLLSKIPEEDIREGITKQKPWHQVKLALAKELAVRRMAEAMMQGRWDKTYWKHDKQTGRDFLTKRQEYIWTGKKYINSNLRYPNFNFSMMECGEYLFLVSHPVGLTGIYACAPLALTKLPDPREAFAAQLAESEGVEANENNEEVLIEEVIGEEASFSEPRAHRELSANGEIGVAEVGPGEAVDNVREEAAVAEEAEAGAQNTTNQEQVTAQDEATGKRHVESSTCVKEKGSESEMTAFPADDVKQNSDGLIPSDAEGADAEDPQLFGLEELREVCFPEAADDRRLRFRLALVGKMAYYRTIGKSQGRQWSQVVLGQDVVGKDAVGGDLTKEDIQMAGHARRHPLTVGGSRQNRWRCEVHPFRRYCVVVCRAPPEDAHDPEGEFTNTQAARFLNIDQYDKVLEHPEPPFIEVPIKQLLTEKDHSDYERACGRGERGEQLRMNR